jgi:hypothetical protein
MPAIGEEQPCALAVTFSPRDLQLSRGRAMPLQQAEPAQPVVEAGLRGAVERTPGVALDGVEVIEQFNLNHCRAIASAGPK